MRGRNIADLMASRMTRENVRLLRELGRLADARGVAAFIVGGVVRDVIMGVRNEDLDVVVEEQAEDFARAAADQLGGELKAHTRFGTAILVLPGGGKIDVATARSEAYERPGALPTVRAGRIADDLRRRDFTINSMAVRINDAVFGDLLDPHSGIDDVERRTLRVLTDHSFEDDPTRILRGVRFAARFGFTFDAASERLLRESVKAASLATVSGERLMNELVLILSEARPWPSVSRLAGLGALAAIEGGWSLGGDARRTFERVDRMVSAGTEESRIDPTCVWMLYFLALLKPVGREVRARVLERLRAGRRLRELASDLETLEARCLPLLAEERELKRSEIYRAAAPIDRIVLALASAEEEGTTAERRITLYLEELAAARTSITGEEITRMGVPEGPAVGRILEAVLDARLDGAVETTEDELALAERLAKNLDALNKS